MKRAFVVLGVLVVVTVAAYLTLQLSNFRSYQLFGEIVDRVATEEKVVALTFDDGPGPNVSQVLAVLESLDVQATFFLTGHELEQNMAAGRKIAAAGHEIGNHSYSHRRMIFKTPGFVRKEIQRTDALIRQTGYQGEIHFRPPNGKKLVVLPYILNQLSKTTIMCDVEPDSYPEVAASPESIVAHVVENVRSGSIILLHVMYPSRATSLEAVPGIIQALRAQGYSFKTVSELL